MRYPALVWQWPGLLPWRFDGRRLTVLVLACALLLAVSAFGWWSLPRAVRAWINLNQYRALVAQRERLGERYNLQVESLRRLQPRIAAGLGTVTRLRQLLDLEVRAGVPADVVVASTIPSTSIYADVAQTRLQTERVTRVSLHQWRRELEAVEGGLIRAGDRLRVLPTILPLEAERMALSSDFGRHRDPLTGTTRFHNGMLLAAPLGARLLAPADGRVTFTGVFRSPRGSWQRLGRMVVLRHGENFATILGHCGEIHVSPGQEVRRGDWVAEVGDSGMAPHPGVYYELRRREAGAVQPEGIESTIPEAAATDGGDAGVAWVPVDPNFYILDHSWGDDAPRRSAETSITAPDYEPLPYGLRR